MDFLGVLGVVVMVSEIAAVANRHTVDSTWDLCEINWFEKQGIIIFFVKRHAIRNLN